MTTEVRPVNAAVKREVARQLSRKRLVAPAMTAAIRLCLFLAAAGGGVFGIWSLWKIAMDDPRFRMDGETLALAGAIRECPEAVAELAALGRRFNGRSILDPVLISDMRAAYGGSGWVRKVVGMRRRFPNRVEVEFLIRVPAAQVWHDKRYWLVDSDATLLPVDGSDRPFPSLPEIVGVTSRVIGNRPAAGEEWNDDGVRGALGVMRAFWGSPLAEALPVERVVVNAGTLRGEGPAEGRRRFEVVAGEGIVVRWGPYNAGDVAGELKSSEKLWNLQELLRDGEALRAGVCFDVRTALPGFTLLE